MAAVLLALSACGGGGGGGGGGDNSPAAQQPTTPTTPATAAPVITTQPQAFSGTAGTEVLLRVGASSTGSDPLQYQWLRNEQPIAGATSADYRFRAMNSDHGARFAVRVSSGALSVQSAAAVTNVTPAVLPDPVVNVDRVALRASVRTADGLLLRVANSETRFTVQAGTWPVGTVFLYGKLPYKVMGTQAAGASLAAPGALVLQTQVADVDDVFTDLKFSVAMNPVAYDSQGKAISGADLLQANRRRALGLGNDGANVRTDGTAQNAAQKTPQSLAGLLSCLTPKGEVMNASTGERRSEFGYEWEIDCSIEKLLGRDDANAGLRFGGSISETGTIDYVFDQAEKTQYQEKHITTTGAVKVVVSQEITPAMAQRLGGYCEQFKGLDRAQNYCEVKADDGATTIEVARTLFDPIVIRPIIGGVMVPMYLTVGLTFKVEVSATGEVALTYTTKKTLRTGHIAGVKVNDNPPAERIGPELTTQVSGKVDLFFGVFVAAGVGESGLFSALQTQVDLGAYAAGAVELSPPCARLDKGAQVGVKVTVGRSRWWSGWDPIDLTFKESAGEKTFPENCVPVNGKVYLSYVVAGKALYTYDQAGSSGSTDTYNAQYTLLQSADPQVPKTLRVDLAGSRAPAGKRIVFDATVLDNARHAFVNLLPNAAAGPGEGAYLVLNPGSTTYGDTLKFKISAYVPGERAATEVSRTVEMKFEPRLEAAPYYRHRVTTDGSALVATDFVYRNSTASLVTGGYVLYDDGSKDTLEMSDGAWQSQASRLQNYCAWYGHDCVDTPTKPVQLVLYTVASKEGAGQVFPIAFSEVTAVESLELTPEAPGVFDILTLKAQGIGLPPVVNVQVPNCRNLQEKRSEGNVRMENWATDYREFTCETTAPGEDLVASVEDYPTVFQIIGQGCSFGEALWRGDCTRAGSLNTEPAVVVAGQTALLWLSNAWSNVQTVLIAFVHDGATAVLAVANNTSERISHVFQQAGTFIVQITLRDGADQPLAGKAQFQVEVVAPEMAVEPLQASAGVQQVFVVSGAYLPPRMRFLLPGCEGLVELPAANPLSRRSFSCTFGAAQGATAVEGSVSSTDSPFGSSPFKRFTVAVAAGNAGGAISSVAPAAAMRTVETFFTLVGQNLPSGTPVVTARGDARAVCRAVNVSTSGFGALCTLFNVGPQTLEVRYGGVLAGSAGVTISSNVTGVSWTSLSTYNSGTVRFGEQVTFKVSGVNLTADPVMGFAVEKCGVSNTEVGTPNAVQRSFTCLFNNEAGAVAGQMPGVVKDAPAGQVLLQGWNVPVEVPVQPVAGASRVPHTGVTAQQCLKTGTDALVDCASAAALDLSGAGKQDGMRAQVNAMSYSLVPKLAAAGGGNYDKTECVRDNITGLMWEGKTTDGSMRDKDKTYTNYDSRVWGTAAQTTAATNTYGYVTAVNAEGLCGYSDWRLPTSTELQGIVDYGVPYLWSGQVAPASINPNWFPNTLDAAYWSETTFWRNDSYVWSVGFGGGWMESGGGNGNRGELHRVRLVRGAQSSRVYSLISISYPGDAANNAVHDSQTGLVWRRCAEGQTWNGQTCSGSALIHTYNAAMARAKAAAAGWRMPDVKELGTLSNGYAVRENNTLDPVAFPNAAFGYWASTPWTGSRGYGAAILRAADGGGISAGDRNYLFSIILVYSP